MKERPLLMKKILRVLLGALAFVLITLILFSLWQIYSIRQGYEESARRYDDLSLAVVASPQPTAASPAESRPAGIAPSSPPPEEGEAPEEAETSPVSVDFEALRQLGGDVIGWICLPDTVINYPVVQGRDNSYYLDHFPDGTSSVGGSIFADCACPSDFSGQNTILYGHNMRDGSMFALIDDYIDPAFCEAHPFFYLNTPTQNYRVDIFAGFTTDPESFVYTTAFGEESDFAAYLNTLRSLSDFSVPTELSSSDRILTLSTCTYSDLDVRYVLFGRLAEIG